MGPDSLDARLQPLAEFLLLLLLLIGIATVASIILSKMAARRRERAHNRVSASKRLGHTSIDLFGRDRPQSPAREVGQQTRQRARHPSANLRIDLSRDPGEAGERDSAGPVDMWLKSSGTPDKPGT
jgi:hypothetical protein